MTTDDILGSVNNAAANLSEIESRLFKVMDIDVPQPSSWGVNPDDGGQFDVPDTKVIYTSDGRYLGTTGSIYASLQPETFFNAVVDNVRNTGMEFDLEKLQYNVLKDGKIIEFRLPTNILSFKNTAGKTDETKMFLNFWTGFGGNARTEIGLYSHRLICSNGMRIINADVDLKVKHTPNMNVKALKFTEQIIKVASQVESTSQMWSEMNSTQVKDATVEAYVRDLANVKKKEAYADLSTRKRNIYDSIQEAIQTEFGSTGTTVWGLLNGATRYTNHLASGASPEYVLTRTGAKTNTKAQELALALI